MRTVPANVPRTQVSLISEFAGRIARPEDCVPGEAVVEAVRQRLFDTLGATLVGLQTPEGRVLTRLHERLAVDDAPCPAIEAARLLVGATRSTEIDDIDIASCTTPGSVVVPTALCVAASLTETDDRQIASAVATGYDAMIRLGRAIDGANALHAGVWPTYLTAPFAAAAVTASLHGMNVAQTTRALSLALARSSRLSSAPYGDSTFRFHALGCAAAEGIEAALAAAAGVEVRPEVLDALAEATGTRFDAAAFGKDFSGSKVLDVDTKLFPTSRQALASVEAFRRQLPPAGPTGDIEEIVVHVPAAYRAMVDRPTLPAGRIESMTGVQFQLALAAFAPEKLYDVRRERLPGDARFGQFLQSVRVRADAGLTARFPATWGSRVDVRWRNGDESSREILDPAGSRTRPPDWETLRAKLDRVTAASGLMAAGTTRHADTAKPQIPRGAVEALIDRCRKLASRATDNADSAPAGIAGGALGNTAGSIAGGPADNEPGGVARCIAGANAVHELLQLAQASCGSHRPINRIAAYAGNNDGE